MQKRARATLSLSYLNINLNNYELPRALLVNIKTVPKAFIKGDLSGSHTLYRFLEWEFHMTAVAAVLWSETCLYWLERAM